MTTTTGPFTSPDRVAAAVPWSPLVVLAEAAARTAAVSEHVVTVVRGFDRESRRRARTVRGHLSSLGVRSVEATPAPDSWPTPDSTGLAVAAVVNVAGAGSWDAHRIAATLRVPLLTLDEAAGGAAAEVDQRHWDLIDVRAAEQTDFALSQVTLLPEDPERAEVSLTVGGTRHVVRGAQVGAGLKEHELRVRVTSPDIEEEYLTDEVTIEPVTGGYRLVRDGLPVGELTGPVTLTTVRQGLVVHVVRA
ncbi:hypothetical protein GCM10012275_29660 [Longimycelium tulufanense]|uniref:Uncharacterized protein n=1 Tax=Longimycelium tulufanense TaxID=907463 RepID=A0A8J3FW42_9PSEU|nr:hypothetical protein [Longimycelium tulufanense]GGM56583.1 hypothetical protein GCM10012275_29660 [Longimycelium tulufanense]